MFTKTYLNKHLHHNDNDNFDRAYTDLGASLKLFPSVSNGRTTYALHNCIDIRCIICLRFFPVRGTNLTSRGKPYQSTPGGNVTQTFANGSCQTSPDNEGAMYRVDFYQLVEINAIEITPGKLER